MIVKRVRLFINNKESLTVDDEDGKSTVNFYADDEQIILRDNEHNGVIVGWVNLARYDYAAIEYEE